jgi:hypothetical protein
MMFLSPFILNAQNPIVFLDDFEPYNSGQQLACQNPADWTTWNLLPCDPTEDPYISTNQAYNGIKSVLLLHNNNLVKPLGNWTSGWWGIGFNAYIPNGKSGYFSTLAGFTPNTYSWALEVFFNVGSTGSVNAGGIGSASFSYPTNSWFQVTVLVNLDINQGTLIVDGNAVTLWQWTSGAAGNGCPLRLAGVDFRGTASTDEMYVDNFGIIDFYLIPVELTSFFGSVDNEGKVILRWTTATELNNLMFEIERKSATEPYHTIGYIEGKGSTTEQNDYIYVDETAATGKYFYRLKQIDFIGSYEYSDEVEIDVKGPLVFSLEQNYPNPFNPLTNIKFSVPEPGNIKLAVYNLVSEEVAVLVDGFTEAGFYNVTFNASSLPSGIYIYKLQSANSVKLKKMMLLK